jgi:hypothetical protein
MKSTTVTAVQVKWVDKLPPLRLARCLVIQSAATLLFLALVGTIAYATRGQGTMVAAAVAAVVCWLGSTLTLVGTARFGRSGINAPLYTVAFGLVFNCALPFVVGLMLFRAGGPLAEHGVFGLMVIFFQFTLVVNTLLSLCLVKSPR